MGVTVAAVGMTVSELARSVAFYTGLLGFTLVAETEDVALAAALGVADLPLRRARLRLGSEFLDLLALPAGMGRPIPADSRSNDLWFQHVAIIVSDMAQAYARLQQAGVEEVSPGPQRLPDWNPAAGGIEAFYFRDPDGHNLEILRFPPGKGEPRWQASDSLFLGIDHTALAVADTARSVRFYQQQLGLQLVSESHNHGPEQERLNHVAGASLRITTLKGEHGPGVELLEYLTPRDGRRMPADTNVADLWHWHVVITRPTLITALAHDPDGHAILTSPSTG